MTAKGSRVHLTKKKKETCDYRERNLTTTKMQEILTDHFSKKWKYVQVV